MISEVSKFLLVGIVLMATACNTTPPPPKIARAGIDPPVLAPGDTALITVEVTDRYGLVKRIEGVVKEDPSITFRLRDDGVPPDRAAGDGVWTLQVDVPFNAPPGDFELDLVAYDSAGQPILIKNELDEVAPLSARFPVAIRYPEQQAQPPTEQPQPGPR